MSFKDEIHFEGDSFLNSYASMEWAIGDSYLVEFYSGQLVPVFLYDTTCNLKEIFETISKDQIIFVDFGLSKSKKGGPSFVLFTFCCKSGVYNIRQVGCDPNKQLKVFFGKKNLQFIGFQGIFIRKILSQFFGKNFHINYTDFFQKIPNTQDIPSFFAQYNGESKVNFDFRKSINEITMKQILTSSFWPYSLSLLYPKYKSSLGEEKTKSEDESEIEGNLIVFDSGILPKKYVNKKWPINSSYKVQFSQTEPPVEVTLFDGDSDCSKPLESLSNDRLIFADFESIPFDIYEDGDVPINVITFCGLSGVFVFHCKNPKGNDQIRHFLSKKDDQKFYTFGVMYLRMNLEKMFGYDIETDIEDISRTRVPKGQFANHFNFIKKHCKIQLSYSEKEFRMDSAKKWGLRNLPFRQVLHTAFIAYGLSLCYENLPPIIESQVEQHFFEEVDFEQDQDESDDDDPKGQNIDYGKISFNEETPLSSFGDSKWTLESFAEIEFFPGQFSKVYLLDAVNDIQKYAPLISCDDVIFFDMEYLPLNRVEAAPVCLFQFCCSKGAFLFRQRKNEKNEEMMHFLSKENGLKFVAKGIPGDMDRLRRFFGDDFEMNIEDVELTRLRPYNFSLNFEKMVEKFGGKPSELFKDKKVSCSNWNSKKLKKIQVIYSAFDVVALFQCYPNYFPRKSETFWQPKIRKSNPKRELVKKAVSLKKLRNSEKVDVDQFWNSNPDMVLSMIGLDFDLFKFAVLRCLSVVKGNKLQCKKCQKFKSSYARKFIEHCKEHFNASEVANDAEMNVKELFLSFLNLTGRVSISKKKCYMCNNPLNSISNLCEHCWNEHPAIINEIIYQMNDKEESDDDEEEEDENDSHNPDADCD